MRKDIDLSKFNTEETYDIEDVNVFDTSMEVDANNRLQITDSQGNQRTAGRWRGAVGSQTENLYINSRGDLVQELNNQQPAVTYPYMKRNYIMRLMTEGTGSRIVTPNALMTQILYDKIQTDSGRYIDPNTGKTYRYVIPGGLTWVGATAGQTTVTSTDGIRGYVPNIWSTSYHVSGVIDRNLTTYHLWSEGSVMSTRWLTIEYPQLMTFSGFLFSNFRTDFAVTSFDLQISSDNKTFTTVATVNINTSTSAELLRDYYTFLPNPITTRFVRLQCRSTISRGAVKKLLLLVDEDIKPSYNVNTVYLPTVVDERYFDLEETPDSFVLSKKSDIEIGAVASNPYASGLLKWENYCRFEQRLASNVGGASVAGTQIRQLNTSVVNNLGISAPLPTILLPAGVYYINALSTAYRVNYHSLLLTRSDGSLLLNGTLTYSGNNTGSISTTRSTIRSVLILEEETPVQLRDYTQVAFALEGLGDSATITADNPDNAFAVMEIWKIRDIEDIDDPSAGDPHWDKVILLLNGTGGWSDQSKYQAPVMNISAVPVVDANYGRGYDTGSSGTGYLYTLPNDRYTFGTDNFTIECWFYPTNTVTTSNVLVSTSNHPNNGSFIIDHTANRAIRAVVSSSSSAADFTITQTNVVNIGEWNHVVFIRSGSEFTLLLNRILVGRANSTRSLTGNRIQIGKSSNISNSFSGIIGGVRVTKGVARWSQSVINTPSAMYSKNTIDTFPSVTYSSDAIDDDTIFINSGLIGILDGSPFNHQTILSGTIGTSNWTSQNGLQLGHLMSNSYVAITPQPSTFIMTDPITVEMMINPSAVNDYHVLFLCPPSSGTYRTLGVDIRLGMLRLFYNDSVVADGGSVTVNTWHHVAFTKDGNTYRVFLNGVMVINTTNSAIVFPNNGFSFGSDKNSWRFAGVMDQIRVSKTIRYTGNFTPPAPFVYLS